MYLPLGFNLFSGFLGEMISIITASIMGTFTEAVFQYNNQYVFNNLGKLILCILGTVILIPIIDLIGNVFMLKGALKHDRILFHHFLNKKCEDVAKIDSGSFQYRMENDPIDYRYYWMEILNHGIITAIILPIALLMIFRANMILALIVTMTSIIKLILPFCIRKWEAEYDAKGREYQTKLRSYEMGLLMKPSMLRILGLWEAFCQIEQKLFQSYFHSVCKREISFRIVTTKISELCHTLSTIIVLLAGAVLLAQGEISVSIVVTISMYIRIFDALGKRIEFIIRKYPIYKNLAERLHFFYQEWEEESVTDFSKEEIRNMEVDDLSVSYKSLVFSKLTFTLKSKDKIAICGENGSGKSTLLRVLCGILRDYQGSIKVNGIDFHKISIKDWREYIAYAPQDPILVAGTVEENIRLGNPNVSEEELLKVIREMGLEGLMGRELSPKTESLSGGERQRISIARAWIKKSDILILDEPSNHLDHESLEWLYQCIKSYPSNVIFVSHSEELTRCANQVVRL